MTNLESLRIPDSCRLTGLMDESFRHFQNLRRLGMKNCKESTITNEAVRHLSNLQFLDMRMCNQSAIADEAFRHLGKLHSLDMSMYNQSTITDEAYAIVPSANDYRRSLSVSHQIEVFRYLSVTNQR